MIRSIIRKPSNLTAAVTLYLKPHFTSALSATPCCRHRHHQFTSLFRFFSSNDSPATQGSDLTRVANLLDGCDYGHWVVFMEPPDGYPQRDQIVRRYIETLAMALGSEEKAKKTIYSVSTKYYYAFSCKIPESMTHMIKSLPNVRWVLPDSHLYPGENEYGGEPFVDGEVVPYDEKYHSDWLRVHDDDKGPTKAHSRKARRKEKKRKEKRI
ncbi:multiple organellar RNA editing factor 7, mitochondrial [Cornus florida]|uniref:multiple organellar RNA editing factor 7, mitochondrial n=1 Tax=Cornus florida TaxID=4283 RepID=UPI00289CCCEF|nr:multiple organellar RNA editing factor 7, mitochondrial [Cornus florida]